MAKPETFTLTAPPSHLMDLETTACSFHVSRQSFHRWNVQPVRVEGTKRFYDFASVIENRLKAAADGDRTPDDAELDRLQARSDLLVEQLEAQRIKNRRARTQYAKHEDVAAALQATVEAAAQVLETIPSKILDANAKTHQASPVIAAGVEEAVAALRAAVIESGESGTGSTEVYT